MKNDREILRILGIWNESFKFDPTTAGELKRKFFQNKLVNPIGPPELRDAFSLAATRGERFCYESGEESKGWILAAGFRNARDLADLLELQFKEFLRRGALNVYYSNMVPDYFFPGIDESKYGELRDLLKDAGFRQKEKALSMDAELRNVEYVEPGVNDLEVSSLRKDEREKFLSFVSSNFSSDWYYRAEKVMKKGIPDQIVVARREGRIVGYGMFSAGEGSMWYSPGERFGPFGVEISERSKGAGSAILAQLVNNMKGLGIKHAYFLWTDERASHLYKRFGFRITREFTILEKELR